MKKDIDIVYVATNEQNEKKIYYILAKQMTIDVIFIRKCIVFPCFFPYRFYDMYISFRVEILLLSSLLLLYMPFRAANGRYKTI